MLLELSFIDCIKQCRCESLKGFRDEWYGAKRKEEKFMELAIEIKAKPGNFHELDQTLQALLPTIREGKGCRECRIYRDVEDGEVFFMSVHWKARESLGDYLRSSNGMALLGAIEMLSEKAGVKIGESARWEGIDTLKRMRKKA
jgi:quinol monooxygenase YgiN